ncbi:cation channel sperm-associated protein 2 isoform X1 [Microcebus murinus]|uniref:cation channel sperm-associated protein 2 isoform X1 n=2 Tax=Microcebus murinus TaxID=30608 RepID=UPI000642F540|nr:cation channel sperm-associated protein 2 isoform X2 [Microcebus murinus]XP_012622107.1 cation channel sperm-associated protein 2 isoform X2 [Microcebus murinus]XP_012622108.1 cation channel sperm-associated protein 2 isoform X2 [Microcebus murinus]XP_012622109.1 cation channel sperm-associated protein 2 isoform X2 [Microcebus murinus]
MAIYQQPGHVQLPRADAIRSRLIDTFSLIEHLQGLSQAVPRHTIRDLLDPSGRGKLMLGDQHQLVRFSIKPQHEGHISHAARMLSRLHIRCSQRPPLSLWAGWVLECRLFTNFMVFLIFLNTIVFMVEIELLESTDPRLWTLKLTMEVAAWFILLIFIVEILLMWLSSFSLFWKNAWNVFDFTVTMLSLIPEVAVLAGVTTQSVWLQFLRICRVLRSLRLFSRFRQIRVIILALVRALKSMTFLLMLLLIFFYIFAVAGVYFFEEYTRSTIPDLEFHLFFSDLLNSLVTVFILFTLDHWYALLQDVWEVPEASRVFSSIYVILWLLLGSIIFRNIIVAMMVTNFQNIRKELNEEMTQLQVQYKADRFKRQIIQRRQNLSPEARKLRSRKRDARKAHQKGEFLDSFEVYEEAFKHSHDKEGLGTDLMVVASKPEMSSSKPEAEASLSKLDVSLSKPDAFLSKPEAEESLSKPEAEESFSKPEEEFLPKPGASLPKMNEYPSSSSASSSISDFSEIRDYEFTDHLDWETLVHQNLPGLMEMGPDDRVVWPRDSLFRYFELLEKLQYNLEERKKLQEFAVQALVNFEDR